MAARGNMAWNRVVVCTVVLVVGAVHALGAANALPVAGVGATRPSSDTAAAAPRARPAAGDVGDSAGDSARGVGGVHGMFPAAELGGHRSRELRRARSPRDDTAPVKLGALPSWLAAAPFLPSVDTPARPVPEPSSSLADAAGGRSGVGSDEGATATGVRGNDERQSPALSWVLDGRPAAGATRLYPHVRGCCFCLCRAYSVFVQWCVRAPSRPASLSTHAPPHAGIPGGRDRCQGRTRDPARAVPCAEPARAPPRRRRRASGGVGSHDAKRVP